MGIHDNWKDFKDPMKQAGKNALYNIQDELSDYQDQKLEREILRSRQKSCEDFYMYINPSEDELFRIKQDSPTLAVKTITGNREITFGEIGIRIQDSNPLEALYFFYCDLADIPEVYISSPPNNKKKNIFLSVICILLALSVSGFFYLGAIYFLIKIFSSPKWTLGFPLKDDDSPHSCTYYLTGISEDDLNNVLNQLNRGLSIAIRYNEWRIKNLSDKESENEVRYLSQLKEKLSTGKF